MSLISKTIYLLGTVDIKCGAEPQVRAREALLWPDPPLRRRNARAGRREPSWVEQGPTRRGQRCKVRSLWQIICLESKRHNLWHVCDMLEFMVKTVSSSIISRSSNDLTFQVKSLWHGATFWVKLSLHFTLRLIWLNTWHLRFKSLIGFDSINVSHCDNMWHFKINLIVVKVVGIQCKVNQSEIKLSTIF